MVFAGHAHDEAHAAFVDEFRRALKPPVQLHDLDLHINDRGFVDKALAVFDAWVEEGRIPRGAV